MTVAILAWLDTIFCLVTIGVEAGFCKQYETHLNYSLNNSIDTYFVTWLSWRVVMMVYYRSILYNNELFKMVLTFHCNMIYAML